VKHSFFKLLGVVVIAILFSSCNNEAAKTEAPAFSLDSAKAAIAASNKTCGAGVLQLAILFQL
jgi:hypothetical protein